MIGKIVTGKSFGGAVEYVLKKPDAELLECDGVDAAGIRDMIGSFNFQRRSRPEIEKAVKHISLSFHPDDAPRLTDGIMLELAREYMRAMDIGNTQYIIVRHNDTGHPHCHIVYNRVKYDRTLVADGNERRRNVRVCKDLKRKYGLTFGKGKERVKRERLHSAEQTKYAIYDAVKAVLPRCGDMDGFTAELRRKGVETAFVHRGGDPHKEIQGITFTLDGLTFKGSDIDRKFSYSKLVREFDRNVQAMQEIADIRRQAAALSQAADGKPRPIPEYRAEPKPRLPQPRRPSPAADPAPITAIRGQKLTPVECRQLYSAEGLTMIFDGQQTRYTVHYTVQQDAGRERLAERVVKREPLDRNPTIWGVQLTDDEVRKIKEYEPVYLRGMHAGDGRTFDGYVVADDRLQNIKVYTGENPREWVRFGKYEMRRMDKDLIEAGAVIRALVKWWGGMGQTARPYLWRSDGKDADGEPYRESWDDPRMSEEQRREKERKRQEQRQRVWRKVQPKKKGIGK